MATSANAPPKPSPDSPDPPPRVFRLDTEHELRFEIPHDVDTAKISLESGAAELFGIELARSRTYPLPASFNAAVFTWHGATVVLHAPDNVMAYTATDTPMPSYVSAHTVLQSKRTFAQSAQLPGPRAVVVGPRDCGKTALVNILAAYCVKANAAAIVVDLDPSGCGAAGVVPGTTSLSVVTHLDCDVGGLVHEKILTLPVGHMSPRHNQAVSHASFDAMAAVVDQVLSTPALDPHIGCIVDTSGDVDGKDGTEAAVHAAKALNADIVFVLGAERLYASIRSTFEHTATETVLLNKSGGVVSRDDSSRMAMQSAKVREYFYGADNCFNPFSAVVHCSPSSASDSEYKRVLKLGGVASVVPDSMLPAGVQSSLDPLKPRAVTSLHEVEHKVLGVSQADKEDDVLASALFGFVHVVKVDVERQTMTVLCPSPDNIPGRFLIAGDMKWIE